MKAVVLEKTGGPENLAIVNIDTPEPKPGELRLQLKASALNRRDNWITTGRYPNITLPCVPGADGAGVVEKTGQGVDPALLNKEVIICPTLDWGKNPAAFGPDFRILGMPDQGTFAEYICVPAGNIYPKPAHLSWEQAAAIPLAGLTSWRAVKTQGEVRQGTRVLVTGAGSGVSTFAILWSVHLGAKVYVSSGSVEKIQLAKSIGVIEGADYHDENCYADLAKKAGGFDVIIDSAGGDNINRLLDTLNPAGRYVFFGATLGNASTGLEMAKLFFRHIRVQGTTMGTPDEFGAMLEMVNSKKIVPVVSAVFALEEAVQAHKLMENYSQAGKIVLQNC